MGRLTARVGGPNFANRIPVRGEVASVDELYREARKFAPGAPEGSAEHRRAFHWLINRMRPVWAAR